jgi:hypothetical protein
MDLTLPIAGGKVTRWSLPITVVRRETMQARQDCLTTVRSSHLLGQTLQANEKFHVIFLGRKKSHHPKIQHTNPRKTGYDIDKTGRRKNMHMHVDISACVDLLEMTAKPFLTQFLN